MRRPLIFTGITIWVLLVLAGFYFLATYSFTPGDPGNPAKTWPTTTSLKFEKNRFNLVMFVHPQCPCSRASIANLADLISLQKNRVHATIVFSTLGEGDTQSNQASDYWNLAATIPGASLFDDRRGSVGKVFGAETSGHVLLFDKTQTRVYSGGITSERGHEGESLGKEAILSLINNSKTRIFEAPIFGCSLFKKLRTGFERIIFR